MDVEFFGLVDVVTDGVEDDEFEEALGDVGGTRDEYFRGFVDGVWRPGLRLGDKEDTLKVWDSGQDFEGLGESAGFVA